MKHAARKTTSMLLSALLLGSSCLMGVSADEVATDPVSVDTENSYYDSADKTYHVALTINETAGDDVTVEMSEAIIDLINQNGYVMSGDTFPVKVTITNNSNNIYKYADNSFSVSTADISGYSQISDFVGYDGQKIPYAFIAAIPLSNKAIWNGLYGKTGTQAVTAEELFNIYNVLADKGYTGETALTDYLLDYFNKEYGADCKSWSELTSAYPKIANEFAKTGTNGIRNMTYSELETLCEKHPEINQNFIKVTTSSNPDQIGVQLLMPEEELAVYSYNVFYKDLFSVAYGMEECDQLNPNRNTSFTRTRGIGDYADSSSELYQQTNSYFASLENANSLTKGKSVTFDMKLGLDGPDLGNGYQNYEFSFANSIGFTRIDTTYRVVHEYYTSVDGGAYEQDGTVVSDPISGMVGGVINADDIEKMLQYGDNEYTYYTDNGPISLVLKASENLIVIEYRRDYTTPVDPDDPDNPNNPNPPVDPSDPGEDINDPDIPTTGGTDTNTGDDTNSDNNDESIDDGETPLAPATGDTSNLAVVLTVVVMASALAVVVLRKKAHN